jgi:hypothetical protein
MTLARFEVDETSHNMDGLLLHAWDESERVEAFISRRVMDRWGRSTGALSNAQKSASHAIQRPRQTQSSGD